MSEEKAKSIYCPLRIINKTNVEICTTRPNCIEEDCA